MSENPIAGFFLLVFIVGLYLIPTVVAFDRKASIRGVVAVVNVFLGWTFIGWVVALAMAYGPTERREPKQAVLR